MVNILAAHMTEKEGRIPQRLTKEKYALGIVTLFPSLQDPMSKKGYEHFYDAQSGSGFLAWRLKTIQRKTKFHPESSSSPKAAVVMGGGPTLVRDNSQEDQLQDEQCKEAISLMTHTNERDTIFQKMQETFHFRQGLIHNPETSASVLSMFPRLLDTKGLVLQDFSLLFGAETAARLLERWPSYKPKLIKEAAALVQTPLLQRLLQSARGEQVESSADYHPGWDSDMSTLLLLLHILSPQPAGRKRGHKISARDAIDHLVVFHKSCQSLDEHLDSDERDQTMLVKVKFREKQKYIKVIESDGTCDYQQFHQTVIEKFGLPPDIEIIYKDTSGTEVEPDIFSELLKRGEDLLNAYVNDGRIEDLDASVSSEASHPSNASTVDDTPCPSKKIRMDQSHREAAKKMVNEVLQRKPGGEKII
ncbi:unnamed protein product [Arctogadus glacialis]